MRFTLEDKSWLDGPVETGAELVACCRALAGHDPLAGPGWNFGALLLADWIMADPKRLSLQRGLSSPMAFGDKIDALLACEAADDPALLERIRRMTDGFVTPGLFTSPTVPPQALIDQIAQFEADAETILAPSAETVPLGAHLCSGRLGDQLPSGPLFHAVSDSRSLNDFLLTGMGFAFRLDVPAAVSMRDALDAGIRACRAAHADAVVSGKA